ncbi:hypothetical protein BC781_103508 [Sediminitomix flava]|uniref:Uncharacterized protein n=1 Tax=Sediminitomix flava TaxID=379075 RepID=A0A315Z9L7_SEDFL|nr:hypothetical protein BC781_103508 [Sediminitomix flava]
MDNISQHKTLLSLGGRESFEQHWTSLYAYEF